MLDASSRLPLMRLAVLLLALLATSASAQVAPTRPDLGARVLLVGGALAGGVGAVGGAYGLLGQDADAPLGVALLVAAYPVGMTLGTVAVAEALGLDAPLGRTAQDALLGSVAGALVGVMVGAAAGGVVILAGDDWGLLAALIGLGVGAATASATSSGVTIRRVRVAPAALAAPTGERTTGLTVALDL